MQNKNEGYKKIIHATMQINIQTREMNDFGLIDLTCDRLVQLQAGHLSLRW